ncbi:hypothetical protein FHS27_006488 [Rhodopirellula rubra]|uniref:Uncharacterized protein n=1 Tax=Aporhodopirellula rubra TaxID=980271 RepID=A0A7W5H9Z8_9BACT|nr:hypothetical protein [Aporhodopirellula rubra]MBB3210640.1 hypothetical protein [Aporhodopirellula rubra]
MGHTAPIQCPTCSAIQNVELKDAGIDDDAATVSYVFNCDCGFSHVFDNSPMEDVIPFIANMPESQLVADASSKSAKPYIWPPDVRATIDKQRRPLPGSEAKRNLRSAALDLPKPHDDQWWLVYDLSPPVVFDPNSNDYAIVDDDGSVRVVGDIVALVSEIQAQS